MHAINHMCELFYKEISCEVKNKIEKDFVMSTMWVRRRRRIREQSFYRSIHKLGVRNTQQSPTSRHHFGLSSLHISANVYTCVDIICGYISKIREKRTKQGMVVAVVRHLVLLGGGGRPGQQLIFLFQTVFSCFMFLNSYALMLVFFLFGNTHNSLVNKNIYLQSHFNEKRKEFNYLSIFEEEKIKIQ